MRWQAIEARFPDRAWPTGAGYEVGRERIEVATTHLARGALGLATQQPPQGPIERRTILDAVAASMLDIYVLRTGDPARRGAMAMLAALLGDWDQVAACTGGAMLASRVIVKKTFADDICGLARHLATAARGRLPATQVLAAITEVRERFAADTLADPRIGVLAAHLFVRDIVVAADVVAATRAWLDGQPLELDASRPVRAVADGEDPRVKIFERFAPELADDDAIDGAVAQLDASPRETWRRDLEREYLALDDLAIRAFVARRPLFANWEHLVDPMVASWLGAAPSAAIETRFRDVALVAGGHVLKLDRGWDDGVRALVVGKADAVFALTGRVVPRAFRANQFFKDDARKLLRYLASALLVEAKAGDVEPAWLDFLARRSPATTPRLERGELHWKHLLALQSVVSHRLGKAPRGETGLALQRLVTGV